MKKLISEEEVSHEVMRRYAPFRAGIKPYTKFLQ